MVISIVMEEVMKGTETPAEQTPGPWVVEVTIAGCTFRRRATRRRDLLGIGLLAPAQLSPSSAA